MWRDVYADAVAHGDSGDEPFFNYVAAEGAAVFTLYGPTVELFVFAAEEADLRDRDLREQFDPLAMSEVRRARRILATVFNKPEPDVAMDGPLAAEWLGPPQA